jgi:hypothetical protein
MGVMVFKGVCYSVARSPGKDEVENREVRIPIAALITDGSIPVFTLIININLG